MKNLLFENYGGEEREENWEDVWKRTKKNLFEKVSSRKHKDPDRLYVWARGRVHPDKNRGNEERANKAFNALRIIYEETNEDKQRKFKTILTNPKYDFRNFPLALAEAFPAAANLCPRCRTLQ